MKREDFLELSASLTDKRTALNAKKSVDYATEDILSNFKRVGGMLKTLRVNELDGKYMYVFSLICLKIDRWINLVVKKAKPTNESVEDTVLDLLNYIDLAYALFKEELYGEETKR